MKCVVTARQSLGLLPRARLNPHGVQELELRCDLDIIVKSLA